MKYHYLGIALAIQFIIVATCQSQSLPDSTVQQLRAIAEGFKERYKSPSIVVAIVHDKDIIFHHSIGYMDMEKKIDASIDSRYPIMSVTKTFTATMYMQLKERNVLGLDDDIKKYVPEFPGAGRSANGITLFQLATHTSGLPRNTPADIHFAKQVDRFMTGDKTIQSFQPATQEEFLKSLKHISPIYPKYQLLSYGDRNYSNLGYSLLGTAIERSAKTGFAEYIVSNICRPLKMDNTGFLKYTGDNGSAKGYFYDDSTKTFTPAPPFYPNAATPAGGMYSTARDLGKNISFQFDTSPESEKILSKDGRAMMYHLRIGWKPSYPFVAHEGSIVGYRSMVAFNPQARIGWVILTNTSDFDFSRINDVLSKMLMPLFSQPAIKDLSKFAGTYQLQGGYDSIKISIENGQLMSTYLNKAIKTVPLASSGHNRFRMQGRGNYGVGYDFIVNDEEEVTGFVLGQLAWIRK